MKWALLLLVSGLTACGHYRPQSAGYRVSSDYRAPATTEESTPFIYAPRGPFHISWPVQRVKINRGYRPAKAPRHEGVDLGGVKNTPILAAHEGVVIYTGRDFRGYGNMVLIEYSREWATLYAHLNSISVRAGQIVRAGDPVGGMGRTGEATGVHLHFELLHKRQPIDPLPILSRSRRFAGLE